MKRNRLTSPMAWILLVLAPLFIASLVSAQVPPYINYQGRLSDDSGDPVTGTRSLTFAIYADSAGGTALWSETHPGVQISDGLFNIMLGSVAPIGDMVFAGQPRWLGISVDGGAELSPRTKIVTAAYAYHAEHADTAGYALQSGGGGWVDDGTDVRLATGSDRVGIGTTDPDEKLHVEGNIKLGSNMGSISFGSGNNKLYSSSTDMAFRADDDLHLQPNDDIYVRRYGDNAWVHFDNSAQRLGVGIMDPPYKLTVQGEISIASGGVSKYHINYYDGGLNFAETGVQDRRIHISDGGNVGIGTANPGAKLGVNGDMKVIGAFKGNNSSSSGTDGAPFPRPAYNSGWVDIDPAEWKTLTHNIGGNIDSYVIDLTIKYADEGNINILWLGGTSSGSGCHWDHLSTSVIDVYRGYNDCCSSQIRIRIWVIE